MLTLAPLCLLLSAFSTLVSARPTSSPSDGTVYNNCSGDYSHHIPDNVESTPFYKPQIHVKPEDVLKNGSGWEEWLFIAHNPLKDGSELMYGFKWAWGDPTSANYSHTTFIGWAYFPNGTFYRSIARGPFIYKDNDDGGFTVSVAENYLTWDPVHNYWHAEVNSTGFVVDTYSENVAPAIPYGPDYKGENGQMSEDWFVRIDAPHAYTTGKMSLPWGEKYDIESVGTLKHTWSYKIMADVISAYVRGSTFFPKIGTVNWYQSWDNSGKEISSMQLLVQPSHGGEVLRLQVTDDSKMLDIVTTPKPVGLPLSYNSTKVTVPMCDPKADYKGGKTMSWTTNNMYMLSDFVDFSLGHTLTQRVNVTAQAWVDGKSVEVDGGFGIVEIYHK